MESRKSKKARSYGEGSKSSRDSHQSFSPPVASSRPQLKDRVKSAPLVAQSTKTKHEGRVKHASVQPAVREGENEDPPHNGPDYSATHVVGQQEASTQTPSIPDLGKEPSKLREVTLAVVGAPQAGKSTFVQCALDLKNPSTSASATKKVSLEGVVSLLRLLEIQMSDVIISPEQNVVWPQTVGGQSFSHVHGALVLYDVMDQGSLNRIPSVLNALSKAAVPTVLVSSKCDNPSTSWDVDAGKIEGFCKRLEGVESFQTSATAPETHKRCVSVILRNMTAERHAVTAVSNRTARPRALTTTQSSSHNPVKQTAAIRSKHVRATSELPSLMSRDVNLHSQGSVLPDTRIPEVAEHLSKPHYSTPSDSSSSRSERPRSPAARQTPEEQQDEAWDKCQVAHGEADVECKSPEMQTGPEHPETRPAPMGIANSFLNIADAQIERTHEGDESATIQTPEPRRDFGLSFDDLVDRLLSQPMSKSDGKFAAIFLCLYRKFAAPSELITAIVHRFQVLSDNSKPQISQIASQLRYLAVLAQWVSDYPGDFAHNQTRHIVASFVSSLSGNRTFAVACKEIGLCLDVVSEDDDTEWACSDTSRSRANTVESFLSMSSVQSTTSTLNADSSTEDISATTGKGSGPGQQQARGSATPSLSSSVGTSENQSTGSFQTLLNSVENAQRQAQLLAPIPRNVLTKLQWHQLMDTAEEDVARELTRIDWIMFSSIRPRDLVRHVSLPGHEKEKCKSLEHVNRMIEQFNHVAFWVANLILLRDKPKHRAKMLEKFMSIGWKLRQLNNYNSLGAIVAGINGTAVHRLAQTRELVPHQAQKQFMRLEILMGTQKSHFAYRLGWANTSSERIPFLPLHRRDLVLAEEGNRTFLDAEKSRINWKKFEVMGEVVVGIQKSQGTPYPTISRNEEVQKLILDGKFPKDDDVSSMTDISLPALSVKGMVAQLLHFLNT